MATNTYVALKKTTLTGTATSVTLDLTGITGYTDLVLVCNMLATGSTSANVQFNSDTGSNYSYTVLDGDGATASSNRQTNTSGIQLAGWSSNLGSSTNPSPAIMHINNYSNSTTYKTAIVRSTAYGSSGASVDAFVGTWRNTAAITSIKINASSFASGSTFSLYGIAAASALTAKATGGTISYGADGYVYHSFTSSGTFTPTQSLSCQVLAVAGGGGGARGANANSAGGGGGGAGQVSYGTFSASISGYSVTVGSGGAKGASDATPGSNGTNSTFNSTSVVANYGLGGTNDTYPTRNGGSSGSGFLGGQPINSGGGGGGGDTANGYNGQYQADGTVLATYSGGGGGAGNNSYPVWASATSTGVGGYYAGGGGGGAYSGSTSGVGANGGAGGGGRGSDYNSSNSTNAIANTGSGGGGCSNPRSAGGGNGASGIVIVRYLG